MKINEGIFYKAAGAPNEIYSGLESLFLEIFDQRPVYNEPGDSRYVSMPKIEAALKNVVGSYTSAITLLVGSIGIGKSSVLRHLSKNAWQSGKNKTIYLDLNRHKTSLSLLNLPDDFPLMERDRQRQVAMKKVEQYMSSELSAFVIEHLGEPSPIDELFDFIWENNLELLTGLEKSFFKPTQTEEKREWLDGLHKKNIMGYLYVCLKYIAVENGLNKLIVIIDNCDQKDPIMIESFVNAVGHLDNCFESLKGSYDFIPQLIPIVSCRPSTRLFLQDSMHSALRTHGFNSIYLDEPCRISSIIQCRITNLPDTARYRDVKIKSANGITWEIKHYEEFFKKVCQLLESSGGGEFLSSLCNRNVADTLKAMSEILSNNKFIDVDNIVAHVVPEQQNSAPSLPKLTILRCLAYGNPAAEVVYSPGRTRIPNILSGKHSLFPRTLLKPKIISLLLSPANNQDLWTFGKLLEVFQNMYAKPKDEITNVFIELYEEGLIETDQGYMPSFSSLGLRIAATPRTHCLWQQLEKTDVLLGMYRDDIILTPRHQHKCIPTHELELLPRCREMVNCCEDCLEIEEKEIMQFINRVGLRIYTSWFDESLLSEKLYFGTHKSILMFYSKKGAIDSDVGDQMERLKSKLAADKQRLFQNCL